MSKRILEEDNIKELIVFSILVRLIRDKGGRRGSVSVLKLHECWHLIERMKIEGVDVSWYKKNPVTRIWDELERAIQRGLQLLVVDYLQLMQIESNKCLLNCHPDYSKVTINFCLVCAGSRALVRSGSQDDQ